MPFSRNTLSLCRAAALCWLSSFMLHKMGLAGVGGDRDSYSPRALFWESAVPVGRC